MRSRFAALVAALALVFGSSAKAEIYTMYTAPTDKASTQPSTFGLNLNISGVLTVPSGNATGTISNGFIVGGLTGSSIVDMNLDATDSGIMQINSSSFSLAALSVEQSGLLLGFAPYNIALTSDAIGISISSGPIQVTNGAFTITSATTGSLALNSGSLTYTLNIPLLGVNNSVGVIDLAADPIAVAFADLGTVTIPGRADDSSTVGFDQNDASSHILGAPGTTGLSDIDTDGAEIFINFAGISVPSTITSGTLALPITVSLTGGVSVGVPEVGTIAMMSVAAAGLGLFGIARRRRNG